MNIITEWERQRRFAIVAELKDPAPAAIPRGWYRAPLASEKIADRIERHRRRLLQWKRDCRRRTYGIAAPIVKTATSS